jgi:hypothetical protein
MTSLTTIELMGGLGNQLFQVCALLVYSWKHARQAYLLPVPIRIGHRTKNYITEGQSILSAAKSLVCSLGERFPEGYIDKIYHETAFKHDQIPPDVTRLAGYFQSYKYLQLAENDLVRFFNWQALTAMYREVLDGMLPQRAASSLVSMHFRLGDYRNAPTVHPIQPLSYYYTAIERMQPTHVQPTHVQPFHVVWFTESNEEDYVRTHYIDALQTAFPAVNFIRLPAHIWNEEEHMLLMAACDHHIIANSTFSYWAAYISQLTKPTDQQPRVCYPRQWFGPAMPVDTSDLCPPEWHAV